MQALLSLAILLAGWAHPGDLADRSAIDQAVKTALARRSSSSGQPWSEVSPPFASIDSLRFLARDLAVADATLSRYGSAIVVQRSRMRIVVRREGAAWTTVSVQVLTP